MWNKLKVFIKWQEFGLLLFFLFDLQQKHPQFLFNNRHVKFCILFCPFFSSVLGLALTKGSISVPWTINLIFTSSFDSTAPFELQKFTLKYKTSLIWTSFSSEFIEILCSVSFELKRLVLLTSFLLSSKQTAFKMPYSKSTLNSTFITSTFWEWTVFLIKKNSIFSTFAWFILYPFQDQECIYWLNSLMLHWLGRKIRSLSSATYNLSPSFSFPMMLKTTSSARSHW